MQTEIKINNFSLQSIAGYEEEKAEAIKIINLFKNFESLKKLGVSITKGLILSGMPGVGKTLMAKVIAAEAGVPIFEYEAMEDDSQESSITNLRALYEKARENSPSIVFIDELDELVCTYEFVSDYTRTVLKTLLTEIDGVKSSDGILTIATTNNYYKIPKPLLRSGRMDKHIEFDLPDFDSRKSILELYSKNNSMIKDISYKDIATKTSSFSGADLKTLVNETLLHVIANNKQSVTNEDFYDVIPTVMFKGIRKRDHGTSIEQVCYHELGHFICEYKLNDNISEISIEKIGNVEGYVQPYDEGDSLKIRSFTELRNAAIVAIGGYAAEKLFMGQTFTGNSGDFTKFEDIIYEMSSSGMLGTEYIFGESSLRRPMSMQASFKGDKGVDIRVKCFDEYLEIANGIINENRELIDFLFEKLKKSEHLSSDEIKQIIEEYKRK